MSDYRPRHRAVRAGFAASATLHQHWKGAVTTTAAASCVLTVGLFSPQISGAVLGDSSADAPGTTRAGTAGSGHALRPVTVSATVPVSSPDPTRQRHAPRHRAETTPDGSAPAAAQQQSEPRAPAPTHRAAPAAGQTRETEQTQTSKTAKTPRADESPTAEPTHATVTPAPEPSPGPAPDGSPSESGQQPGDAVPPPSSQPSPSEPSEDPTEQSPLGALLDPVTGAVEDTIDGVTGGLLGR